MADSAILAAGGADAPLSYIVPGSVVITIKQIHVKYVDNGAGGDWLPAVRIVNDAGHTMGTAADQAVKVTTGSDADVSFFPGVKHAAAAAGTTDVCAWARLTRVTPFTVPTTSPTLRIPWTGIHISDPTVFTMGTHTNANDEVNLLKLGVYIAFGAGNWHSPRTYPHSTEVGSSIFTLGLQTANPVTSSSSDTVSTGEQYITQDFQVLGTQAVPGKAYLLATNWDGVNHAVDSATFGLVYLPNATAIT
jgi:hypothetical protein